MLIKRLTLIAIYAVGTFAVMLALGLPSTTDAVDNSASSQLFAPISNPQLVVNGVMLTVVTAPPATQPSGATAVKGFQFYVRAENKTAGAANGKFTVDLSTDSVPNPMARVPSMPKILWTRTDEFALNAGETKTFSFNAPSLPTTGAPDIDLYAPLDARSLSLIQNMQPYITTVARNP